MLLGLLASGLIGAAASGTAVSQSTTPSASDLEFFEKRVRPVLAANCWRCHGPKLRTSDLRLDSLESILTGGQRGAAIVPGRPDQSRLIRAVQFEDRDLQMPPVGKLPEDQIADLTAWVAMGAPWPATAPPAATAVGTFDIAARRESHWAWQPLRRHEPPGVRDVEWPIHPIDRFVLAKLEEAGIRPSPPSDRRTLLRRIYFDLIGLPPDPAQLHAFLSDGSENAYERLVDRLLASPRFGERWGRHWLDLVRYAETYGHEFDYPIRNAWRYRDYIIRALNADVPYDQLVTEHLAGDLLSEPRRRPEDGTNESIIGTGFWFFGQATHAPVDVRADQAERIDNQIDVMTKAFLGLTVACARCHDHKFDAISTADYYALAGFLRSSRLQQGFLDPKGEIARSAGELKKLHRRREELLGDLLQRSATSGAESIAPYLQAAHEVMYGNPRPSDGVVSPPSERVIEDFEKRSALPWRAEGGAAFASGPAEGARETQKPVLGYRGKRLLNSFSSEPATGRLVSERFAIRSRYLRFLAGGRGSPDLIGVRLLVDGQPVRRAPLRPGEALRSVEWDLQDQRGKHAVLEIADDDPSGYILVDHLVLSNRREGRHDRRPVAAAAREAVLDPHRLEMWVQALQDPNPSGIFYPFHAHDGEKSDPQGGDGADRFRAHRERALSTAVSLSKTGPFIPFESFDQGHFQKWFVTGEAFGDGPTVAGTWDSAPGIPGLAPAGVAHSGLIAGRLQGALRSETFTITRKNIHYRVAGTGGQVRLIIDGYVMDEFNPLLFKGVSFSVQTDGEFRWINQSQDVGNYVGHRAHIEILDHGDGYVAVDQIRFSDDAPPEAEVHPWVLEMLGDDSIDSIRSMAEAYDRRWKETLAQPDPATMEPSRRSLLDWMFRNRLWAPSGMNRPGIVATLSDLDGKELKLRASLPQPARVIGMADGSPEDEYVFIRGSYKNAGPVVPRRFLEALSGTGQPPISKGSGRLELAGRMLDPGNPLPARALVNRVWHHLFGRGIVASTDNFGVLGEKPSHPELLDYLALRTLEDGWSLKRLIRSIVTSRTYRMASDATDPVAEEKDPANILLHRMSVRRLEGEAIRDSILALSGRLDTAMYGPPVPVHLTPFMEGRGRPKQTGPLDGDGRRSIYQEVRRNFLAPMMLAFDTPIPHSTIGRRTVSNVPAQALILMNDRFVVEQARLWARRTLREVHGEHRRIRTLYEQAFSRPPTEAELEDIRGFLKRQAESYGLSAEERGNSEDLWADLCHSILNVKESIFIR